MVVVMAMLGAVVKAPFSGEERVFFLAATLAAYLAVQTVLLEAET
jgi:hypothetical protein